MLNGFEHRTTHSGAIYILLPCPVTFETDWVIEGALTEFQNCHEDFTWRWAYQYRCGCCNRSHVVEELTVYDPISGKSYKAL